MIAKSEFSEVISDVVLLLEKQIPDFTRKDITDFLEVLNSSDDEKLRADSRRMRLLSVLPLSRISSTRITWRSVTG